MEMEQPVFLYTFHRAVYIQKCNLFQRLYNSSAAGSALHLDQAGVLELGKDPADDDRVHIDAGRQKIAGYLILFFKCFHTCHHMDSNGKSA